MKGLCQISPGDLTNSHSDLEGMSNCTQCHDLGSKVSSQKCLACHDEIETLINQNKGYHASREVKGLECAKCHSEHHGRKFDMIRFDQDQFDHNLTGYKLEGQHKVIDCKECHQSENIADREIKKRQATFLGLDNQCLSCHDDYHQKTLSNECITCHNFEAFDPASKFNHNETKYPLKGNHQDVSCLECHPKTIKNNLEFQQFTGIEFNDCKSCHDDPHQNNLPGKCTQCHSETSFQNFAGQKYFNHNLTDFKLKGKHNQVSCFECHQSGQSPKSVFQDKKGIVENDCNKCHEDHHEGRFGLDCAKCHVEESFLTLKEMDFFDHNVTDFPLEGLHSNVDCKSCHQNSFSEEIDFKACRNCHDDYHNGEFYAKDAASDCIDCHNVENPFTTTTYGLEEHLVNSFPLEGAHLATPCFACHVSEDQWTFTNIGNDCVACHEDIHISFIDEKYYPEQNCITCHNTDSWQDITFDHTITDWDLTGSHININCSQCHFEIDSEGNIANQSFKELNNNCFSCHDNVHGDQFKENGITDCVKCHSTNNWEPTNFDHSTTNFPLEGKHIEIDCNACHKEEYDENGIIITNYKIEKFECIDCHS